MSISFQGVFSHLSSFFSFIILQAYIIKLAEYIPKENIYNLQDRFSNWKNQATKKVISPLPPVLLIHSDCMHKNRLFSHHGQTMHLDTACSHVIIEYYEIFKSEGKSRKRIPSRPSRKVILSKMKKDNPFTF